MAMPPVCNWVINQCALCALSRAGSPLVLDSFAACHGLLQRIESVYAGLGDQHMAVLLAQDKCKRLESQQQQAVATQQRDLVSSVHDLLGITSCAKGVLLVSSHE